MANTGKKAVKVPKHSIRLACCRCDRTDYDGIDELPEDWAEVGPVLHKSKNPDYWWTHLGFCPECQMRS